MTPNWPDSPAKMLQNVREIGSLWSMVAAGEHRRVLEVGSLFGGTLWAWSQLPAIELLVSIDQPTTWPPAAEEAATARSHWAEWFEHVPAFVAIAGDSTAPAIVEQAAQLGLFDFAFIDGDHSYEGVRADWLSYSPLVRSGGLVAFHDTWPGSVVNVEPGVAQWVDELRRHRPSIEWTDPDGVGICAFVVD